MAKRRTRKQKSEAKHVFTYSWKPTLNEPKKRHSEANVKGQLPASFISVTSSDANENNAYKSENNSNLASIKNQIYKSLALALVILASEVVIYLVLK